jgi:hypothetical protein
MESDFLTKALTSPFFFRPAVTSRQIRNLTASHDVSASSAASAQKEIESGPFWSLTLPPPLLLQQHSFIYDRPLRLASEKRLIVYVIQESIK